MPSPWWIPIAVGTVLALAALSWRPLRTASREARFARARRSFHLQRERLEAKFVQLAGADPKFRTFHWDDCDFDNDVAYVRNRTTGELSAFVAVTVGAAAFDGSFSALGLGDLVGNLRAGTAIFRFDRTHWETDGRAILNLSPAEAIRLYQHDIEMVDQD